MRITFHLSTRCNLRCTYCYQKDKTSSVLSFEDAKALLDDLFIYRSSREGKIFKFSLTSDDYILKEPIMMQFFGGECTLFIDLIDQICSYFEEQCKKYNYQDWLNTYIVSLVSNGLLNNSAQVQTFYDKYLKHLNVQISMDGCKKCHDSCRIDINGKGSYDRAESAIIDLTQKTGVVPRTKLTFCKENMLFIKEIIQNLYRLGYTKAEGGFDKTSSDQQLTIEESEIYYNYLKEAIDYQIDNNIYLEWGPICFLNDLINRGIQFAQPTCGSLGDFIAINWEGNLYTCCQLSESYVQDKNKEMCLGNVHDGITNLKVLNNLRGADGNILPFDCFDCPFINLCEPCPARNILIKGEHNKWVFNCGASMAEIKAMFYFIKRAKETNYPYFKESIEKIDKLFPNGFPERNYLVYNNEY